MGKRLSKLFKTVDGQRDLPKWFKTAALLLDSISIGSLIIELPDKRQFLFSSKNMSHQTISESELSKALDVNL